MRVLYSTFVKFHNMKLGSILLPRYNYREAWQLSRTSPSIRNASAAYRLTGEISSPDHSR